MPLTYNLNTKNCTGYTYTQNFGITLDPKLAYKNEQQNTSSILKLIFSKL
jgi:hypothetical protein